MIFAWNPKLSEMFSCNRGKLYFWEDFNFSLSLHMALLLYRYREAVSEFDWHINVPLFFHICINSLWRCRESVSELIVIYLFFLFLFHIDINIGIIFLLGIEKLCQILTTLWRRWDQPPLLTTHSWGWGSNWCCQRYMYSNFIDKCHDVPKTLS